MDDEDRKPTAGEARAAAKVGKDKIVTAAMARQVLRHDTTGLWADFPDQNGDRSKGPVPLSFLLKLDPSLQTAIAEGYAMHCLKHIRSADRRYDMGSRLNRGLVRYLAEPDVPKPSLADIDESFLHRFKAWLDDDARPGFLPNRISRGELLSAVQLSLERLMESSEWKKRLSPRLRLIQRPYPKMVRDVVHTATLNEPDYEKLYAGAALDIAATTKLRVPQLDQLDVLKDVTTTLDEAGRSPVHCAAWLEKRYKHPVPTYVDVVAVDAEYGLHVSPIIHAEAERILYPDLDEVVPMVLVVCAFFALNPSTAFKLRKGGRDYRIDRLAGLRRSTSCTSSRAGTS